MPILMNSGKSGPGFAPPLAHREQWLRVPNGYLVASGLNDAPPFIVHHVLWTGVQPEDPRCPPCIALGQPFACRTSAEIFGKALARLWGIMFFWAYEIYETHPDRWVKVKEEFANSLEALEVDS